MSKDEKLLSVLVLFVIGVFVAGYGFGCLVSNLVKP